MGIETKEDMQLGADIFSPDHEPFAIFRDGRFVTDKVVYTQDVCYDTATGEEMDSEACETFIERASTELNYSDMIINGDLLRFKEQQDLEKFPTISGKQLE
jgi:lipoteichoic acid synthase